MSLQMDTMSNEAPKQVPLLGHVVQKDWSHGHKMDDHNMGAAFWQERSVMLLLLSKGRTEHSLPLNHALPGCND